MGEYLDLFGKYADSYDAIVHISLSSELSSSYQNACLAADEFSNVTVIDSRNLSTGQGLVVLKACEMAQSGAPVEEIKETVSSYTEKVEASFLIDQLGYMVKGGRCSAVAALGANLLGLKPCIEVKNGKMGVVKKYRGNYSKCLATYVKDRIADREDVDRGTLFVTHSPVSDECKHAVKEAIEQCPAFENTYWTNAGCTISCHCGPGTLGVLFVRK
jgi:DegV family protein with EDD domain